MLPPVSQSELLESEKVAWLQVKGTLQIARGLVPVAFAAVDHAGVPENTSALLGSARRAITSSLRARP
jgi:hypothetical protein